MIPVFCWHDQYRQAAVLINGYGRWRGVTAYNAGGHRTFAQQPAWPDHGLQWHGMPVNEYDEPQTTAWRKPPNLPCYPWTPSQT